MHSPSSTVRSAVSWTLFLIAAIASAETTQDGKDYLARNALKDNVVTLESGLQYRVIEAATNPDGEYPKESSPVTMHIVGKLIDGTVFDAGLRYGEKFYPTMRVRNMLPGLREAVKLMKVGDKWEVTIPSELGYGDYEKNMVPASAVMIFSVEIAEIGPEQGPLSWFAEQIFSKYPIRIMLFVIFIFRGIPKIMGWDLPGGPLFEIKLLRNEKNPRVYFDIAIDGEEEGRIIMELFPQLAPKTCENFKTLCTGRAKKKKWTYKGCTFHRIIEDFMCQGGDFTNGNGTGGRSIFEEEKFDDEFEKGVGAHEKYVLSMANAGKNSNGSQFFITTNSCPHLNGVHVVFGCVVEGKEVVDKMGSFAGTPPTKSIVIKDCGEAKNKST